MSDSFQTVVDLEATLEQASGIAVLARNWLVDQGIIEPEVSDSTLGNEGGHKPGRTFSLAIDFPPGVPGESAANVVPTGADDRFLGLIVNGVAFEIGRRVFDAGENGIELQCPSCRSSIDHDDSYLEAVDDWYEGNNLAVYHCPHCVHEDLLKNWRGPFAFGFGNLGIVFWNWPPLSEAFINSLSLKIGHQTMLVRGRI